MLRVKTSDNVYQLLKKQLNFYSYACKCLVYNELWTKIVMYYNMYLTM